MDQELHKKLQRWHQCIEDLAVAEETFLSLQANEKPMFAKLYLGSEGKSSTEREQKAYASEDWRAVQQGIVSAQVEYQKKRRQLELYQASFQAEYLSVKTTGGAIQRYPSEVG